MLPRPNPITDGWEVGLLAERRRRLSGAMFCAWAALAFSAWPALSVHGQDADGDQAAAEDADESQPSQPAAGAKDAPVGKDAPAPQEQRVGRLIRISSPITDKVDNRIKRVVSAAIDEAKEKGEWPVLIFEIEPGRSDFGQAYDLAHYLASPALNGATTVAYVPEKLTGHAVLVAMACEEIIMGDEAELGEAGAFETSIKPSMRNAYIEVANIRKTIPADVALKMLDPAIELLLVETDVSREFVRGDRLEELKKKKSFGPPKVIIPAGKPGLFSAAKAREYGFATYLANDRQAVAKALSLPAKAVDDDFAMDGQLRPVRIALKGPISAAVTSQVQNLIQTQINDHDVNLICLWIESPGGSPDDSVNLANYLIDLNTSERRTVAYIPHEARGDAAYIALACDHIVMHPRAVLGGYGAYQIAEGEVPTLAQSVAAVAADKHHSAALAEAMVDPKLTVYKYTRQADGLVEYFTEEQAKKQDKPQEWIRGEAVTHHGEPLHLTGEQAEQCGLLHGLVDDFNGFKVLYGLENDPTLIEPGWADYLVDALNSPGVSLFLLFLGGAALYAELQSPGIGLGGLIAALCFMLYFWSAYLGGTAGWLEVLMFVAGVGCLLLEIFVLPGFGLFGLAGGLLVIGSLIMASQTFVLPRNAYQLAHLRNSLLVLAGAGFGTVVAAAILRHYLPHAPMFSRMLLTPPSHEEMTAIAEREALARFDHLVGSRGTAFTPLVPSGKARLGEQIVDVLTEGEFVDRGQAIEVVEVRGHRVLVRAIS